MDNKEANKMPLERILTGWQRKGERERRRVEGHSLHYKGLKVAGYKLQVVQPR